MPATNSAAGTTGDTVVATRSLRMELRLLLYMTFVAALLLGYGPSLTVHGQAAVWGAGVAGVVILSARAMSMPRRLVARPGALEVHYPFGRSRIWAACELRGVARIGRRALVVATTDRLLSVWSIYQPWTAFATTVGASCGRKYGCIHTRTAIKVLPDWRSRAADVTVTAGAVLGLAAALSRCTEAPLAVQAGTLAAVLLLSLPLALWICESLGVVAVWGTNALRLRRLIISASGLDLTELRGRRRALGRGAVLGVYKVGLRSYALVVEDAVYAIDRRWPGASQLWELREEWTEICCDGAAPRGDVPMMIGPPN